VDANLIAPVEVTTVLGNLLDNAIEAVRSATAPATDAGSRATGDGGSGSDDVRQVEIELVQEGATLHVTVADSGPGVPPDMLESVFVEGVSTKSDDGVPGGRGVGLALSRQVARALGGDVVLAHPGGGENSPGGAEFIARLPGVLVEGEVAWAQSI
ncbi:sensor histidine kinase, partial [Nocardia gipuzkoensis]